MVVATQNFREGDYIYAPGSAILWYIVRILNDVFLLEDCRDDVGKEIVELNITDISDCVKLNRE